MAGLIDKTEESNRLSREINKLAVKRNVLKRNYKIRIL